MKNETFTEAGSTALSRRRALRSIGTAAGVAAFAPSALAQPTPPLPSQPTPNAVLTPTPSVISNPRRDYNPGSPVSYPDPDIVTIDPAFAQLRVNNTAIQRLFTGGMWDEGPAWCSQGRYLVWSDIPNDRQLRYIEDDGRITVFRQPSNNSIGNTFDHQELFSPPPPATRSSST
jgi:gluconolactonase